MLVAGQRLVSEIEPDAETKFGFHDPPFLSVHAFPTLQMLCNSFLL